MTWFRVDDNLAFHPKVLSAGNAAMGLWVRAGSWAAQQLTDGFVPDEIVATLGGKSAAKRLETEGLWERATGGWLFHGWAERQPSRAQVEADRAAARERMQSRRKRSRSSDPEDEHTADCSPEHPANFGRSSDNVRALFGDPDPTRPDPMSVSATKVMQR